MTLTCLNVTPYNQLTIAMIEIRNRKTLQSKNNVCKSDVKAGTEPTAYTQCHMGELLRPDQGRKSRGVEEMYPPLFLTWGDNMSFIPPMFSP